MDLKEERQNVLLLECINWANYDKHVSGVIK